MRDRVGALRKDSLVTIAGVVCDAVSPEPGPYLFKSTGMAWEDAVIAARVAGLDAS